MAELMYKSTDLRRKDPTGRFYEVKFYIARGWVDDVADVRGVDTVVPSLSGRTRRNRVKDVRSVVLNGLIQAESFDDLFALQLELGALFSPAQAVGDLVVSDGYLGVTGTATLSEVVPINVAVADVSNFFMRRYSWELECTDSPPDWVIDEGSS